VSPTRVGRLVSGGQTGADRAALDVAIERGLDHGGWCPRGGWAEDLTTPPGLLRAYPGLRETPTADPAVRTRRNVRDSHATLVVRGPGVRSPGTDLTVAVAVELDRPRLVTAGEAGEVVDWLLGLGGTLTLHVAGPRESEQPGTYDATRRLLGEVLDALG
jgi:hypothetical protein